MKETKVVNEIGYHITAKELTVIHKLKTRLQAYKEAEYLKEQGFTDIKITMVIKNTIEETIEENY